LSRGGKFALLFHGTSGSCAASSRCRDGEPPCSHRSEDARHVPMQTCMPLRHGVLERIKEHLAAIHPGERLPCPVAEDLDCTSTFAGFSERHRYRRRPCPLAEQANCTSTFGSRRDSRSDVHGEMRHPSMSICGRRELRADILNSAQNVSCCWIRTVQI